MKKKKTLLDRYRFPGCRPKAGIKGLFGDSHAIVIQLQRTQKKHCADSAALHTGATTIKKFERYETSPAEMPVYIWRSKYAGSSAGTAER